MEKFKIFFPQHDSSLSPVPVPSPADVGDDSSSDAEDDDSADSADGFTFVKEVRRRVWQVLINWFVINTDHPL